MARATRTYKLRLSATGLDVLIASHCYMIRETRSLLAWGTTLHVAVEYLDGCSAENVGEGLGKVGSRALAGDQEHHLGAPHRLGDLAGRIVERYRISCTSEPAPTLGNLYIAALVQVGIADTDAIVAAFERVQFASQYARQV